VIPGQPWELVFSWLCLAGFFSMFWFSPFWALPTMTLTSSAAAVSIGVINMCGNVAGAIGSPVVGMIKDGGGTHAVETLVVASFVLGAVFVALVQVPATGERPNGDK
jgi:ACS family tartrate transporter-like MFS transporter